MSGSEVNSNCATREKSGMKLKLLPIVALFVVGWMIAFAPLSHGQISCHPSPGWTRFAKAPQVNQNHIFCGELKGDRPKGFHSRPGGINPVTVTSAKVTQPANNQGIYGIQWIYAGTNKSKFSTMFPDRCSQGQVLTSIRYAAANPVQCPAGAPNWAWCGLNQPPSLPVDRQKAYCLANNNQPFVIAGASLDNGNINTAFPLR